MKDNDRLKEIIDRVQAGDLKAREIIMCDPGLKRYIYKCAIRHRIPKNDLDDFYQDVQVKLIENFFKYDENICDSPRNWLITNIKWSFGHKDRTKKRQIKALTESQKSKEEIIPKFISIEQCSELPSNYQGPFETCYRREVGTRLRSTLNRYFVNNSIKHKKRCRILVLRLLKDQPYDVIAKKNNSGINAVHDTYYRILNNLSSELNDLKEPC